MQTLREFLTTRPEYADGLGSTVLAVAEIGADLAALISRGPLGGALGAAVGENTGGDKQIAIDVKADNAFAERLMRENVRWYASEEQEHAIPLNPEGAYALAIDPLDGSSNADVNVSIGTIFSIFPARDDANESFLRRASDQVAAGYVVYGPQTTLVVTAGDGVSMSVYDREAGEFIVIETAAAIAPDSTEYAINASNYRHWPKAVRSYIDDMIAGQEGPRGRNFNMRWVASLVAETHRILMRGGIFLYPGDDRKGYAKGRLRLLYECAPIAMLIEQAGGLATDGTERILDKSAEELHQRTPFVFGAPDPVSRVVAYHDLPESEVSPLFGRRGLFKS